MEKRNNTDVEQFLFSSAVIRQQDVLPFYLVDEAEKRLESLGLNNDDIEFLTNLKQEIYELLVYSLLGLSGTEHL